MSRGAARSSGRTTNSALEKKVNILTALVAIQIVLLLFVMFFLFGGIAKEKKADLAKKTASSEDPALDKIELSEVQPVVEKEDKGILPPEVELNRSVRIELLNGCGVKKLASHYAELLRKEGYDIRSRGNADHHNYPNTLVIDRTNLKDQALRLAKVLGTSSENVSRIPDPKLVDIDITLILGKDYKNLRLKP